MPIEVKREPDDPIAKMGIRRVYEQCCFCWKPTAFWYVPKDVAVCELCAAASEPEQVPTKEAWCKQADRRAKNAAGARRV